MNVARVAVPCAAILLAACGGAVNTPPMTAPVPSSSPTLSPASGTANISPAAAATTAPLPDIGGIYGGELVLPPGSGTGTATFSLNPPTGVAALTELTPSPQIAYVTITAQSTLVLSGYPGLNLAVPTAYMGIDMWLNYYSAGSWNGIPGEMGWPSTVTGISAMCFRTQSASITLARGQSLYMGINGDDVLPTPIVTTTPPPCPQ